MKRVVIAGGSGFIGSGLTRGFTANGYHVTVLSRSARRGSAGVAFAQWDGVTAGPWTSSLDGAVAVINLSGASIGERRWSEARKKEIVSSRVDSTEILISAMSRVNNPPKVLVNSSGIGYYGDSGDTVVDESSPAGTGFLAETVMKWEDAAAGAGRHGIRHVALRTGMVLGQQALSLKRLLLPFRLFTGGPLGHGRQWLPWVHLDDVAAVFRLAVESDQLEGPVNLCSPEQVRMKEFCVELGRAVNRPSWLPVPSIALRLLLGEMSEIVLTGQRAVPRKLESAGYSFRFRPLQAALGNLF